jgi:hypothetical protein
MSREFSTVYELLDAIRPRPAMWLGHASIGHLSAFLSGLSFADLDPGSPSIWGFTRWITARVDGISANLPCMWLEENLGTEAALEAYFRYLDEYRVCKEIEVAVARLAQLIPRFFVVDSAGNKQSPPSPDRLYVGQFAPSKVFFLGEDYGGNVERCFPYHRTLKGAIAEAKIRWSVPVSAWKRQRTKRCT